VSRSRPRRLPVACVQHTAQVRKSSAARRSHSGAPGLIAKLGLLTIAIAFAGRRRRQHHGAPIIRGQQARAAARHAPLRSNERFVGLATDGGPASQRGDGCVLLRQDSECYTAALRGAQRTEREQSHILRLAAQQGR
jgi:hypothetical protein